MNIWDHGVNIFKGVKIYQGFEGRTLKITFK